ncbi:chromate transporter [Billgrantia endophytica]|uniref:Chromate transporter n=1 Tax=Billgrantia endophytica TaxID=2033802 RepID=A0A2N7U6N9_9GAMM|nr:chromate transporter [Halomonas endophytica]PMR76098.1 chromate transporter [Halomonas endophytica]
MNHSSTERLHASQRDLFWTFLRVGLLGYGGGPSMIPLVQQEVVKRHGWFNDEEFADILAIGNTLPGPIATKMPGYIGYRLGGTLGCINAVLAVILPTIIIMVLLLVAFTRYRDIGWIHGMGKGVVPVVMVMMAQLTWDFWAKSRQSLGWMISLGMVVTAGVLIYVLGVHPGVVIALLLATALLSPGAKREDAP